MAKKNKTDVNGMILKNSRFHLSASTDGIVISRMKDKGNSINR
jgi:hypothetical protein